jgi:hypothetical protein
MEAYRQRAAGQPRARLKVTKQGSAAQITPDHPNEASVTCCLWRRSAPTVPTSSEDC